MSLGSACAAGWLDRVGVVVPGCVASVVGLVEAGLERGGVLLDFAVANDVSLWRSLFITLISFSTKTL